MAKNRICTKCGKRKSLLMFSKDKRAAKRGHIGFQRQCKACCKEYNQTHKTERAKYAKKYLQIHRIKIHECLKKYRQSDEGKRVKNKLGKKYYQTHKTECRKRNEKYRQTFIGHLRCRFQGIKSRCNNPKNTAYKHYGGRGIKCLFKNANDFIDYVINGLKVNPQGLDIDRVDNDGHYGRGNIRFISHAENLKNRRKYSKSLERKYDE